LNQNFQHELGKKKRKKEKASQKESKN
jgi:hypothetical protein